MKENRNLLSRSYFPWLGLALPLLLTLTAWVVVRRTELRRIRDRFEVETLVIRDRIAQRIVIHEHILLASAEFASRESRPLTRQEWRHYVAALKLESLNPGIQGLGYAEWIPLSEMKAHVARVRAEGFPDYEVRPGGPLSAEGGVSSIIYLEPFDQRNQRAFSRDMLAEATRREAMHRARDTGSVSLSGRVTLYQEGLGKLQAGTLLYAPVYHPGRPLDTVAQRRAALRAWAYLAFRMENLLDATLGDASREIQLELFDGDSELEEDLLYERRAPKASRPAEWATRTHFKVAGRAWTLRATPGPGYRLLAGGSAPISILTVGGLCGLSLFLLLAVLMRSERQAILLADQRSEELRTLLDATGEAIYGLDLKGHGTFFNPACLRMLGYASDAPLLGKNIHRLIHHTYPDESPYPVAECPLFQAFHAGVEVHVAEEVFWRADGSSFPVECWSYPQWSQGRRVGAVVTFLDITVRKEVEAALLELNRTLEARVAEELEGRLAHERALVHQSRLAAMGEMVGNIAHQWRQPLNALSMVLANLQDAHRFKELTDERFAASMSQGGALIQKMTTTITDFMDFFRPAKEAVAFSVRKQVLDAVQLVAPSLQHLQISVELLEGPDVIATGFPNELSQVILNLLANSRDAIQGSQGLDGQPGLIRIEVSRAGDTALLRVSDNGGGVPVAPLERIFEPYFTNKETGTGLGLYMSKVILERSMKGTIAARNIPGGVEFTLTIPLAEAGHATE